MHFARECFASAARVPITCDISQAIIACLLASNSHVSGTVEIAQVFLPVTLVFESNLSSYKGCDVCVGSDSYSNRTSCY